MLKLPHKTVGIESHVIQVKSVSSCLRNTPYAVFGGLYTVMIRRRAAGSARS